VAISGIGIDIVELTRMRGAHGRHGERLVRRICTELESETMGDAATFHQLSRVFAVKEAVMKALGTGMRGVGWKEIETCRGASGAIESLLSGRALDVARRRGVSSYALSVTSSSEFVLATVLLASEKPT